MPELPEVERAACLVRNRARNRKITLVETMEDNIVYSGISHSEFGSEITGRTVKDARRYGKLFFIELDGEGRNPVLHFGMTGTLQIQGENPLVYGDRPKKPSVGEWPPRFVKFILHMQGDGEEMPIQLAFIDPRRLGRIRLRASPLLEPPISELGFDPLLSMPTLENFKPRVQRRFCPIKALLLDQSFSAGVGNWVADEILYHSHIHPEQRCNTLKDDQLTALHTQIVYVCKTAVDLDADEDKFPMNWLFKHRWGKGKRKKDKSLMLPDDTPATISWITVGGRTSAYVIELQRLDEASQVPKAVEMESDSTYPSDESLITRTSTNKRKAHESFERQSGQKKVISITQKSTEMTVSQSRKSKYFSEE